jgi:N utilization substance protein A
MRLRAYVVDVKRGSRGPQITLSRRSPALLRRLLELEVPEIFNGSVEIKAIAREAGSRSKVAVHATQDGVDPVGSCVGVRGGRIQNVVNELEGEKIDVVQWAPEIGVFIANSLSPAKVMNVILEDASETGKTATVIVPDRQLSLAIGKEGQNARLAAKLTGWRIDIKSATEAAEETLGRLEDIKIAPEDMDLLTLAERLLISQEAEGLSDEQRELVEAAVKEQLQEEAEAEAETEAEVAEEPETEEEVAPEVEPAAPEMGVEEMALDAEPTPAVPVGQEDGLVPESYRPTADVPLDEMEEEPLPPLAEVPLQDSTGWVPIQPEEDFYSGWSTEKEPEEEESEWVREEFPEEPVTDARRQPRRKRGRRRGRRERGDGWGGD